MKNIRRLSLLLAASVFLLGCDAEKKPVKAAVPVPATNLVGTQWSLEDLAGQAVTADARATLTFPENGRVSGNASCNRFTGPGQVNGSSLKIGNLALTRMLCEPTANEQEQRYIKALGDAERFEIKDDKLLIYVKGMEKPLRFVLTH